MKIASRSAIVALAFFLVLMVYGCGAGPQGDCSTSPEQGSCVNTSDDGSFQWRLEGDEILGWCGDGNSPNFKYKGGEPTVDPKTGKVTIYDDDGDPGLTAQCNPG